MITFPHLGYIGRLGNQIFQYAALLSISMKHNEKFYICNPNVELYKCFDISTPINSTYNSEYVCTHDLESDIVVDYQTIFLTSDYQYHKLLNTDFDKKFFDANHSGKSIFGFFQNYKYFSEYENQLRSQLIFKEKYTSICNFYFKQRFSDQKVLSLHIRRTDYLESSVLNNLQLNYYKEALDKFDIKIPVLVFSDDIEWCQNQNIFNSDRFIFMKSNNTYIDLCLMSLCNYHIIANSSFSWWGSWLAKSEKTIVPKQWFTPEYSFLDSEGLRLPNWISL